MSLNDIHIRFATENDISTILNFISELAEFEKLAHEVIATEDSLRKHLFGNIPRAEVILICKDNIEIGFALFFHNFSTFIGKPGLYLEDLYIKPEHRGSGIGKAVFYFLAKLAVERDCGRIEWWVLDWNQKAIDFYQSLGAKAMNEWTVFRLTEDKIKTLATANMLQLTS